MPGMPGQMPLTPPPSRLPSGTRGQVPLSQQRTQGISGQVTSGLGMSQGGGADYQKYQREQLHAFLQSQQRATPSTKRVGGFLGFGGKTVPVSSESARPRTIRDILAGRPAEPEQKLTPLQQLQKNRQDRDMSRQQMKQLQDDRAKLIAKMNSSTRRGLQQKYSREIERLEKKTIEPLSEKLEEQERKARARYF